MGYGAQDVLDGVDALQDQGLGHVERLLRGNSATVGTGAIHLWDNAIKDPVLKKCLLHHVGKVV